MLLLNQPSNHLLIQHWQCQKPGVAPCNRRWVALARIKAQAMSGCSRITAVYKAESPEESQTSAHCPSDKHSKTLGKFPSAILLKSFGVWCVWSGRTTKHRSTLTGKCCGSVNPTRVSAPPAISPSGKKSTSPGALTPCKTCRCTGFKWTKWGTGRVKSPNTHALLEERLASESTEPSVRKWGWCDGCSTNSSVDVRWKGLALPSSQWCATMRSG